jgi:uncharacterized protein
MSAFFVDHLFLIPVLSWIIAVLTKAGYIAYKGNFSIKNALGSGGMPSVHSALVTSLTTAIGIKYSVFNDLFLVCLVFSTIIIYDAINVRFEAGLHAKALNDITGEHMNFNESIGHLPQEAFVGSLIGILTAVIFLGF